MSSSENGLGHEELARRVEELEEENARLRGLLGFEHRQGGGHATAWAPTLLAVPSERVPIDAAATDAEKLALLWSLFGGAFGCVRHPLGERVDRQGGMVAGVEGWLVAAAVGQGLLAVDRRRVPWSSAW